MSETDKWFTASIVIVITVVVLSITSYNMVACLYPPPARPPCPCCAKL